MDARMEAVHRVRDKVGVATPRSLVLGPPPALPDGGGLSEEQRDPIDEAVGAALQLVAEHPDATFTQVL